MTVDAERIRWELSRNSTEWVVATVVLDKSEAIAVLLDCLNDPEVKVRQNAAWILSRFAKGPSHVPVLEKALNDDDANVRSNVALTLEKIGFEHITFNEKILCLCIIGKTDEVKQIEGVLPTLVAVLKQEGAGMRQAAASGLGRFGDATVVPALIEALKDDAARLNAAGSLAYLAGKGVDCSAAVPSLIAALKDSDSKVRLMVSDALASIGLPAVPALASAFKDGEKLVQRHAIDALAKLVREKRHLEKYAVAVPMLLYGLRSSDAFLRPKAADLLAKIAEVLDIDLREVQKALQEHVEKVRKAGNESAFRTAVREAARDYTLISRAVGKRLAEKHSGVEGVLLEGTVKQPPNKRMYRQAERRAIA